MTTLDLINMINFHECPPNKCKPRDNKFGVTWCIKCGKLFTKPSGIKLENNK